jgi:hypothetical protein
VNGYSTDRAYSDRFIPTIKQVVGPHLIVPADLKADIKQATDMTILTAKDMTVACRVRRPGYVDRYGWQFTMRSKRDSGAETELSKIVKGWADWMLYAFAQSDDPDDGFARWFLIDLKHWRCHLMRRTARPLCGDRSNNDGTYFAWFDVRSFDPDPPILVASSCEVPKLSDRLVSQYWLDHPVAPRKRPGALRAYDL